MRWVVAGSLALFFAACATAPKPPAASAPPAKPASAAPANPGATAPAAAVSPSGAKPGTAPAVPAPGGTPARPVAAGEPGQQTPPTTAERPATGRDAQPEIKPYDRVITKEAKSDEGIFTVHRVKEKVYYEIPKKELGRDFLWVTQIARTTLGVGYGGQAMAAGWFDGSVGTTACCCAARSTTLSPPVRHQW